MNRLWKERKVTVHDIDNHEVETPEIEFSDRFPSLHDSDDGRIEILVTVSNKHDSKGDYKAIVGVDFDDLITEFIRIYGDDLDSRTKVMTFRQVIRTLRAAIDRLESELE